MKKAICALAALAAAQGSALAQNTQLSAQGGVIDKISAAEMIKILQSVELSARLIDDAADGTKTIEASSGGDFAYVALRACEGAGAESGCEVVQPFGFFNAQGVTLEQLNNFNMNLSTIATAALLPDRGIVATKFYLNGGVTKVNLTFELGLYFADIGRLLEAVKPGAIARISWKAEDVAAANAGLDLPAFPAGESAHVNAVGVERDGLLTEAVQAVLHEAGKVEY